eukprot:15157465-Alexandrium_andersonii.AAC.1
MVYNGTHAAAQPSLTGGLGYDTILGLALLLLQGSAWVRGAFLVPSAWVVLAARKLHGQRAPAARR